MASDTYIITPSDGDNSREFTISPYSNNGTISPTDTTLDPKAISANTSIVFQGKGTEQYGQTLQTNLYNILENFSGSTEPVNPIIGQQWFDSNDNTIKVFTHTSLEIYDHINNTIIVKLPGNTDSLYYQKTKESIISRFNNITAFNVYDRLSKALIGNFTPILAQHSLSLPYSEPVGDIGISPALIAIDINDASTISFPSTSGTTPIIQTIGLWIPISDLSTEILDTISPIPSYTSFYGPISHKDFGNNRIRNIADPIDNNDSVSLQYLNSNFYDIGSDVILNQDPTLSLGAATKQYVDAVFAVPYTTVGNLSNVTLSGTSDGDVLTFNSTLNIWENKDILSGINIGDFMQNTNVAGGSADTLITSGAYRIDGSLVDIPNEFDFGQVLVIHSPSDTIAQIAFDYTSDDISWRSGNPSDVGGSGVWGSWRKIFHDGNMGAGSGLDADTLDGYNSSDFFRKNVVNVTSDSIYLDNGTADTPSIIWQDPTGGGSGTSSHLSVDMINESLRFISNYRGTTTVPLGFNLATNTFIAQHFYSTNDCAIGSTNLPSGSFANGKALAFGDADTGIRQNGDGVLELWANDQEIINIDSSNIELKRNTTITGSNQALSISSSGNDILACTKTAGNTAPHTIFDASNVGFRFFQNGAETLKTDNDTFTYKNQKVLHAGNINYIDIVDYLTNTDGTVDQTTEWNLATTEMFNSGRPIYVGAGIQILILGVVNVSSSGYIFGDSNLSKTAYKSLFLTESTIVLGPSAYLRLDSDTKIEGLRIISQNVYDNSGSTTDPRSLFAGTGIHIDSTDVSIENCLIAGFTLGIDSNPLGTGRTYIANVNMDNTNGMILRNSLDTSRIENVHMWPFFGSAIDPNQVRTGVGFHIIDSDWTKLTNCFTWGYGISFRFSNFTYNLQLLNCGADGPAIHLQNMKGMLFDAHYGRNILISGFQAAQQEYGIHCDLQDGIDKSVITITNSQFILCRYGVYINGVTSGAIANITGNTFQPISTANNHPAGVDSNVRFVHADSSGIVSNNIFYNMTVGSAVLKHITPSAGTTILTGPNIYIDVTNVGDGT